MAVGGTHAYAYPDTDTYKYTYKYTCIETHPYTSNTIHTTHTRAHSNTVHTITLQRGQESQREGESQRADNSKMMLSIVSCLFVWVRFGDS